MRLTLLILPLLAGCTLWRQSDDREHTANGERTLVRTEDRQEIVGDQIVTLRTVTTEQETTIDRAQEVRRLEVSSPIPQAIATGAGAALDPTSGGLLTLAGAWAARELLPLASKFLKRDPGPQPTPEPQPRARPPRRREEEDYEPQGADPWR